LGISGRKKTKKFPNFYASPSLFYKLLSALCNAS
jgi:hypothetical protein